MINQLYNLKYHHFQDEMATTKNIINSNNLLSIFSSLITCLRISIRKIHNNELITSYKIKIRIIQNIFLNFI